MLQFTWAFLDTLNFLIFVTGNQIYFCFYMFLVPVIAIFIACLQDYAYTAQIPTKTQGESQTSLVPFSQRLEAADNCTVVPNSNHPTVPSLTGQTVPCSYHKQDDCKGSLAVQPMQTTTSQQTQSTLLWGMWNEVAAVHRLHLCAQCTSGSSAALSGPVCSLMDMAVERWRPHTSAFETKEYQCSTPAPQEKQRQRQRQGQRRRERQAKREGQRCSSPTTWTSSATCTRTTALDGSTAIDASSTSSCTSSKFPGGATAANFSGPTEEKPRSTTSGSATFGSILGWINRTVEGLYLQLSGHHRPHCGCTASHEGSRASMGPHQREHGGIGGHGVRDGRRDHGQSRRQDSRRIVRHGQNLGRVEQDSRGHRHAGLRAGCQKSQKGEGQGERPRGNGQGRRVAQAWICIHAAFWPGPLSTTEVCLDDALGARSTLLHDPTLKWRHSVCSRKDFVSDWEACTKAFHLAAELNQMRVHHGAQYQPPSICKAESSKGLKSHVRFAAEIEILLGIEEQISMALLTVPESTLSQWQEKPWALNKSPSASVTHDDADDDDFSLMQMNGRWTPDDEEGLQQALISAAQSGELQDCPVAVQNMVQQMMDPQSSSSNTTAPGPPRTEMPEALRNLRAYFQTAAPGPDQHHRYLNTWYINHEDHLVCERPRQVLLHADPTRWTRQVVQRWSDRIVMMASFQFFLVRPHPPASAHEQLQHPHLIIQQLPQPGRRSILISASMTTRHPGQYVHWATTMPAVTQKRDVMRLGNVNHLKMIASANFGGEISSMLTKRYFNFHQVTPSSFWRKTQVTMGSFQHQKVKKTMRYGSPKQELKTPAGTLRVSMDFDQALRMFLGSLGPRDP